MKPAVPFQLVLIGCLFLISASSCTTADRGPRVLELTFLGDECVYNGPTQFTSDSVRITFINKSEGQAAANLVRHDEGHSIQEMMDLFKDEPITGHHPDWTTEIIGVWKVIEAGETHTWEGTLESGIYTLACVRMTPFGVWFGAGLTVKE